MSTSILYHGFDVIGYHYLKTEFKAGKIIFHIEKNPLKTRCSACGSRDVIKKGKVNRLIRTLPIGRKPAFLSLHLHRLECHECGVVRQEELLVSRPKKHWTKSLGRFVVDLLRYSTVEDVARHLKMSWGTIKEIHLDSLRKKYSHIRLKDLRYLGVDEIAIRKGHNYMTIVLDLESGRVVWACEGRKMKSIKPFLRKLKRAKAKIQAIAMDMWVPYISSVLKYFSHEVIVFDRYHIIQDYNRTLDEIRKQQTKIAPEDTKSKYKNTKYLLMKGREKIEENSPAEKRLKDLLELNHPLYVAYVLKEDLRALWECESKMEAHTWLCDWFEKARASGIRKLIKFSQKLAGHMTGILNYFVHRISSGKVEGTNNKIKVLKRKAYGFRDMEYFKFRIYALHESRYALVG